MQSSKKRVVWIILGGVLAIGAVASVILPVFNKKERFTELDRNMMRLKSLATAVRDFADDKDGRLPGALHEMVPAFLSEEAFRATLYRDPASGRTQEWLYYGNAAPLVVESTIILASPSNQICPPHLMHHRIIGHRDTVVQVITDEDFHRKLADQMKSTRQ